MPLQSSATVSRPHDNVWFRSLPIALSAEDFSAVAEFLDGLREEGVTDLLSYLDSNTHLLDAAIRLVRVVGVNDAMCKLRGVESQESLLGQFPANKIDENFRASMRLQLNALWEGHQTLTYTAAAWSPDGPDIDVVMYWSVPQIDGKPDPSRVLLALSDISSELEARRSLERAAVRQNDLYEIGVELASTLDLDSSLELIVGSGRRLLGCDMAVLFILDHESRQIVARHIDGAPAGLVEPFVYDHLITGHAGEALVAGGLIVADRNGVLGGSAGLDEAQHRANELGFSVTSLAIVPVQGSGSTSGVLVAGNFGERSSLSEVDLGDLRLMAGQAAVALQRAAFHQETVQARDSMQEALDQLRQTQQTLVQAQKMESIGVLAAGVAHEINTPVQFIGDNVTFLTETFKEVMTALGAIRSDLSSDAGPDAASALQHIAAIDLDYLLEDVPLALSQTTEGIDRVATIVRALKEYSHPGSEETGLIDLSKSLATITTVTRSEWRTSAAVEVTVDPETPTVWAVGNELNQVFLNLIVNAVHAIVEHWGEGAASSGRITIEAEPWEDGAEVRVSDNGAGIPPDIQDRIFDQFFTTKEVGKGTGQGLALAYRTIVQQHSGTLTFESEPGEGTTFRIRLPKGAAQAGMHD